MSKMLSVYDIQEDIGDVAASILKRKYNGNLIYVSKNPNDQFPSKKIRNENIINDFHNGMEIEDIEKKYDLKRSQIYKIVKPKQDTK